MAWLNPNQLSMFEPSTFPSENPVTSSPASAVGHSPLTLPAGLEIAKSGPAPVLVSLSRAPDRAAASLTNVICGPSGSGSSASIALARSLASRLKARLDGRGSTLFSLTWKPSATPAGRSFSLLRASARRTSDTERTGWPTPQAHDAVGRSLGQKAIHGTKHGCACLARSADLAGWPTPREADGEKNVRTLEGSLSEIVGPQGLCSGSGAGRSDGFWDNVEWLPCRDGKWRPTQPGLFPLSHGTPARVGRLRAYGNAICVPQAVEFIKVFMET